MRNFILLLFFLVAMSFSGRANTHVIKNYMDCWSEATQAQSWAAAYGGGRYASYETWERAYNQCIDRTGSVKRLKTVYIQG